MSKYIDIDNEEEILKECDFDYFYNSENCSSELCAFYNDIWRNGNNENFDKSQALIDLGRIGIVLNNQSQQIAELKAENERLSSENGYLIFADGYDENDNPVHKQIYKTYKEGFKELVDKNKKLQQQLKDNTKQVCEKIRDYITSNEKDEYDYYNDEFSGRYTVNVKDLNKFLDQIEKGQDNEVGEK